MKSLLKKFTVERDGTTAIEYSLIAGLIFLALIAGVTHFASVNGKMWNSAATTMQNAVNQ